ncbi:hypothetical protein FAZ15_11590 [Sphingobacterium olei]|uniref:Uncharacterized protein n=1 Tax=Sphingobacterium olei TaxID=2571155 RepID=A0A4V5MME4_9SPHI|nr:hypothetical protein [Sphingobacterium olei]TJZ60628.1 hypothetical protein FAZ15_11590 [Sphingobacterium olei]
METKQLISSVEEATATVLPRWKASESFLIPWQDERPYKLSKEYILQFYEDKRQQTMYISSILGGILPLKLRPSIAVIVSDRKNMSMPTSCYAAIVSNKRS